MKQKIAIPTNNDVLNPHFGHCKEFTLIDVEEKEIKHVEVIDAPPHEPGLLPPFLAKQGVTDVIAGGMGQQAITLFNEQGVNVLVGAPQQSSQEIVKGYLSGYMRFTENNCTH